MRKPSKALGPSSSTMLMLVLSTACVISLLDGWVGGWVDGGCDGLMEKWMDGWMDAYIDQWMHACINEGWGGAVGWEWESFFPSFHSHQKHISRSMKRLSESSMKHAATLVYVTSGRCLHRCRTVPKSCLVVTNMKYFRGAGGWGGPEYNSGRSPLSRQTSQEVEA